MYYNDFQGENLSALGFGTMRLPLLSKDSGDIDMAQTEKMLDLALANGVNYIDTAWPYHSCKSELAMGKLLKKYPRNSFYLATKFPGHQIMESYDPKDFFETQLKKCGVDYFDFYLLHNVYEKSIETYLDPRWGIMDYLLEQKKLGRIRHLGFSSHAGFSTLKRFLGLYGDKMEFCQIQLNYVDWTLQNAKSRYELLTERGIPVWVMEPLRGGRLAAPGAEYEEALRARFGGESPAETAFRWLQGQSNVKMILSGMSTLPQMEQNIGFFSERRPLNENENAFLAEMAEKMKNAVPCTGCRYCCAGCPMELDIPGFISTYNDIRYLANFTSVMWMEDLPAEKRPEACIGCGQCSGICPQGIDVPAVLADLSARVKEMPSWKVLSRQRVEDAAKVRREMNGDN